MSQFSIARCQFPPPSNDPTGAGQNNNPSAHVNFQTPPPQNRLPQTNTQTAQTTLGIQPLPSQGFLDNLFPGFMNPSATASASSANPAADPFDSMANLIKSSVGNFLDFAVQGPKMGMSTIRAIAGQ